MAIVPNPAALRRLAQKLGQSLAPGRPGLTPQIEKLLGSDPQMYEALSAAEIRRPAIPRGLRGSLDVQDLLQEALLAVLEKKPQAAEIGPVVEQAMTGLRSRLKRSPETFAPKVEATLAGQLPAASEESIQQVLLGSPAGRRPSITLPNAMQIMETLPQSERDLVLKATTRTAESAPLSKSEHGLLTSMRKRLGLTYEGTGGRKQWRKSSSEEASKEARVLTPDEVDRAVEAYNRLFQAPPEIPANLPLGARPSPGRLAEPGPELPDYFKPVPRRRKRPRTSAREEE